MPCVDLASNRGGGVFGAYSASAPLHAVLHVAGLDVSASAACVVSCRVGIVQDAP